VRAARPVAKQAELTASYLSGALLLAPLEARQAALRGVRGFTCRRAAPPGARRGAGRRRIKQPRKPPPL
jgi:hypothetical protein